MKRNISVAIVALFSLFTLTGALFVPDKAELGVAKNYIANGGIERGKVGFITYKGGTTQPTNGTGGSPTHITITASTSSPLRDSTSLNIINSGSTSAQGEGTSYAFSIDSGDQGSLINVSFDYSLVSGTFVAGSISGSTIVDSDLEVYIYDVTNSQVIQPSGYILTCGAVVGSFCTNPGVQFQAASNSSSYRLIWHVPTVNTAAWTMKIDNIVASRLQKQYGSVVTDWTAYTPTFTGLGTVTSINYQYRRNGSNLEVQGTHVNGTTVASLMSLSLPGGLSIDSTRLGLSNTTSNPGPTIGTWVDSGSTVSYTNMVAATATSTTVVYFGGFSNGAAKLTAANGNNSGSGVTAAVNFKVPIAGWSPSVQMSDSASSAIVAASVYLNNNLVVSANTDLKFDTVAFDTNSAYNVTTGLYTVPVSGFYRLSAVLVSNGNQNNYIEKNGAIFAYIAPATTNSSQSGSITVKVNAGDTLSVRPDATATYSAPTAGNIRTTWSIEKINNPAAVANTETISASYFCSSNCAGTTTSPFNFDSKEFDDHNAVTTGASWSFTAPASGLYEVVLNGYQTAGTNSTAQIWKNAAGAGFAAYKSLAAGNANYGGYVGSTALRLNAGDQIQIRPAVNVTIVGGTLAGVQTSTLFIQRTGN